MPYAVTGKPGNPLVAVIPGQARGMADVLQRLARCPVVAGPMAGGSSTAGLVTAVSAAGALGFLAAGYKSAAAMRAEMDEAGAGSAAPFGVNLFVPGEPTDPAVLRDYLAELEPDAAALGVQPGRPDWTDDDWDAKLSALLGRPPAVGGLAFGRPGPHGIADVEAAGGGHAGEGHGHHAGGGRARGPAGGGGPGGPGHGGGCPPRDLLRRPRRGGARPAAAAAAGRRRGGHQPPPGRRGGDHEWSG